MAATTAKECPRAAVTAGGVAHQAGPLMNNPNRNADGGPFGDDDDIGVLRISIRAYNALARADINRISDLLRMSDKQILATPGIGAGGLEDIKQALDKFVTDDLEAFMARDAVAPQAPPEQHPIDAAINALRAAAESVPDDGYSGWRATFHRMADVLPDREYRERIWGED